MTDENERRPDPNLPDQQPADPRSVDPPTADETRTQWVPADRPPAAPSTPEDPGGWFSTAPTDQPRWANWDEPWDPDDEPFDQSAPEHRQPEPFPDRTSTSAESAPGPQPAPDTTAGHASSWANLHALRVLAQVACPILLLVGLTFGQGDADSGWEAYTAWAVFAAVCSVIQLAPLVGRSLGLTPENAWFLGAVGTAGLVGYWVILVLPGVSSNAGFAQTLAAGFAVIGLWLSPGRRV